MTMITNLRHHISCEDFLLIFLFRTDMQVIGKTLIIEERSKRRVKRVGAVSCKDEKKTFNLLAVRIILVLFADYRGLFDCVGTQ